MNRVLWGVAAVLVMFVLWVFSVFMLTVLVPLIAIPAIVLAILGFAYALFSPKPLRHHHRTVDVMVGPKDGPYIEVTKVYDGPMTGVGGSVPR